MPPAASGRLRVLLAFGGRSGEHTVSLRSATEVLAALDLARIEPVLLGVTKRGELRTAPFGTAPAAVVDAGAAVTDLRELAPDVVFPLLHGPYGEDGRFQGLLESLDLPYVGSGVQASAIGMDKAVQKLLVGAAAPDVPQVPWVDVRRRAWLDPAQRAGLAAAVAELGYPVFVKPSNMGSSVGVSKVREAAALADAVTAALHHDDRVVIERGIDAREIEVAVLGDGGPDTIVSPVGEIVLPPGTWYDYDTKYVLDVARTQVPADVTPEVAAEVRRAALRVFEALGLHGMARIDFFVERGTGVAYLNEPNTLPGFTSISMYPQLMAAAGVPYPELIVRLCELGIARHAARRRLDAALHGGPAVAGA
jgi:D-alanine-D-alanine ligase